MKWLSKVGFIALFIAHGRTILKIFIYLLLMFFINALYQNWRQLENFAGIENFQLTLLICYSVIQCILVIVMLVTIKGIVWIKEPNKIIEAKKSLDNIPEDYMDFSDVIKYPNLDKP